MILLVSTSDLLKVDTDAAAAVDVHASFMDYDGAVVTPGRTNTAISTATSTTVVASPSVNVQRNVKALTIFNKEAAVSVKVTVKHTDGSTVAELCAATLYPGQSLVYLEGTGFVLPQDPGVRVVTTSTADQSVGASTTAYLTGSALAIVVDHPIRIGTVFRWTVVLEKSAAGTVAASFDVRFGTAGTTADTSRANFSTGAQTGAQDWAWADIEAVVRGPIGASCVVEFAFRLSHNANATGFAPTANVVAVANATFDVTTVGLIAGLSITTGALHAYTIHIVTGATDNL